MEAKQLIQITPEELQKEITKGAKSQFDGLKNHFQSKQLKVCVLKYEIVDLFKINILSILFQITKLHGLQNKTTSKTKHQLGKSYKLKKGKKMIEIMLSIFQKSSTLIQIIDPDLLDLYHYKTIYYLISFLCILSSIYINHRSRTV